MPVYLKNAAPIVHYLIHYHSSDDFHLPSVYSQVLGLLEEPGSVSVELHEVHHQLALSPLPFHCGLCSAWHAALWRTVCNVDF